jgi:hypothetical protein
MAYLGRILKRDKIVEKLIIDSGDPYYLNKVFKYVLIKKTIEKRVSEEADYFIIPVKSQVKDYPFLKNNYKVIPQIFSNRRLPSNYPLDNKVLNIFYSGLFIKHIRDPYCLFKALSKLKENNYKFRFHYFGDINKNSFILEYIDEFSLKDCVSLNSVVDRELLLNIMDRMDSLVNILNSGLNQFPSKLQDYYKTQANILNIGYDDSVQKFGFTGAFVLNDMSSIFNYFALNYTVLKSDRDNASNRDDTANLKEYLSLID